MSNTSFQLYKPKNIRQILSYDPLRLLFAVEKIDAESNDVSFLRLTLDGGEILYLIVGRRFHEMHPNVISSAYIHGDYLLEASLEPRDDSLRLRAKLLQILDERQLPLIAKS